MGKTEKKSNSSQLIRTAKPAEVSDTETESSSEEENGIPVLNITNKIKSELKDSSEDSESDSDNEKNQVFTQKSPPRNIRSSSSFSKDPNKYAENGIKKEESSEDSDSSTNKNVFETNKYIFSKSSDSKLITKNNQQKQISHDSDDSSSSSEQDTLKGAFLGQVKAKSKKQSPTTILNTNQKVTVARKTKNLSNGDLSDDVENQKDTVKTPVTPKKIVKAKKPSKLLSPETQKSLPEQILKQNNVSKKITPEKVKQKKNRKSDSSITENSKSQENVVQDVNNTTANQQSSDVSTDTISIEEGSNSQITNKNKVQVLQHIKFTPLKPKELLQDLYPNLTPIQIKDDFKISNNEEIYLLRIPKSVNPQHLVNKELDLTEGSRFKIDKQKYELEPTNKVPDPLLLVGSQASTIQPKNTFFLKKYIKSSKIPDLELTEKTAVPLPENLKTRHPLFGSHYEDKIQLSQDVELRLQKAIDDCLKQNEKIKKKKKPKTNAVDNTQNEVIFSLLGSHTTSKNNHKEEQYDSAFGSSESHFKNDLKKKTKRKSFDEPSIALETKNLMTSREIDEVSPKKSKKKKKKSTDAEWVINKNEPDIWNKTEQEPFTEELSIIPSLDESLEKPYKKKDKKRRSSEFVERSMFESTRIDVKMEPEPPQESAVDKQKIINETLNRMKTELFTEYESEWDETLMKKTKKKKKRKSLQQQQQDEIDNRMKAELLTEYESEWDERLMKKTKKKKKQNSLQQKQEEIEHRMKTEMLTEYESEWDETLTKTAKKKKKLKSLQQQEGENIEHRVKAELLTEYESEWDETLMKKTKKKKKRKSLQQEEQEEIDNEIINNIKKEIIDDFTPSISNKRKRSMSIFDEHNGGGGEVTNNNRKSLKVSL